MDRMMAKKPMGEKTSKGRMPHRGKEAMADMAKGTTMATPAMPSPMGQHMPVRGESAMAATAGHVDGLAKLAGKSAMVGQGDGYKMPVRATPETMAK